MVHGPMPFIPVSVSSQVPPLRTSVRISVAERMILTQHSALFNGSPTSRRLSGNGAVAEEISYIGLIRLAS